MSEVKRKRAPKKEMPVIEESGATAKKLAEAKKLSEIIVGVDTSVEDVVKYSKEGRRLLFGEDENFLKLPEEIVRQLSVENRRKYDMAKNITLKQDVVGTIEDGLRGWVKDYNVIPGAASGKTIVTGKDPKMEYHWASKEKLSKHLGMGFQVTRDPNVKAGDSSDTCTYKTIGGENKPEMVLVERPKSVGIEVRARENAKADQLEQATLDNYVETAARKGFEATVD